MQHTEEEWTRLCKQLDAFWLHDENPKRPHALLTKGGHSNGFFYAELLMESPVLLDGATSDLLALLKKEEGFNINSLDRVVGPAMGAITICHDIARHVSNARSGVCFRSFAEKTSHGAMAFPRTSVHSGENVLLTEDVITTGGSVELTAQAVIEAGGVTLPFVLALVNRSGLDEVFGKKIIALINQPMSVWSPEECPLCKQDSQAIRPKEGGNWVRLTANY